MEHYNPILGSEADGQKFITCGEIMLRLTPPNYEKIRMASSFEASYGGSEANIALALANLGVDSTFFSVVPNNSLGKSAVRWLRSNDVHCTPMILTEPDETPSNRLGTYYLETGYGIRASKVIYDRKHSVITEYDFSQVDLDALLDGFDWLHLSGITPALAPNCRGLIIDMLKTAKKKGLTVSFDGNFRSTLWTWEEARDFCTECLPYVDVLLGIEPYHLWKDETDHSKGDWKDGVPLQPSYEQQDEIFQHFIERYPNLKCIARHVRYAHSGSENSLKAFMWYEGHTFESKLFTFNILDRVGGGDAFASGLIYAMLHDYKAMDMINFAVASSAVQEHCPTIGVLGVPIDKTYPATNRELRRQIEANGCVISEYPPESMAIGRVGFLQRNRLIAALSMALVVVEAQEKSGTMSTVAHAERYGKPVFAVPGSIYSPNSAGTNGLLREGRAKAVCKAEDLFSTLRLDAAPAQAGSAPRPAPAALSDTERRVLACIGAKAKGVEEIGQQSGLPTALLLGTLMKLELTGRVTCLPGKRYILR